MSKFAALQYNGEIFWIFGFLGFSFFLVAWDPPVSRSRELKKRRCSETDCPSNRARTSRYLLPQNRSKLSGSAVDSGSFSRSPFIYGERAGRSNLVELKGRHIGVKFLRAEKNTTLTERLSRGLSRE